MKKQGFIQDFFSGGGGGGRGGRWGVGRLAGGGRGPQPRGGVWGHASPEKF